MYVFYTQICFGECNEYLFKVKNSCGVRINLCSNVRWFCKYLKQTFKIGFVYKFTYCICGLIPWINRGYFVVKKNYEMFVLKLSGIQNKKK